ncbi:MAG: hypothetical protein A3I63_08420 [Betaproteobacteria bacterium RIFCSPLOWO2_02_FULL_66_14]|nr:MAG: hypothetical protein A3I63_08420 [Betaproteobacteria bacterium RIFCSPLOWO2_02_FULL_66_14]
MAQIHADPEQLKRFARDLSQFNIELANMMSRIRGSFSSLSDTWSDQEHAKFAEEFSRTMRQLDNFIVVADEHIPLLVRKAEHLERFLTQR